jgi:SulP family sulfate permease
MTDSVPSLPSAPSSVTWLSDLIAGLVIGFSEVILALSLASLIFTGALQSALPRGIGVMLITATVHMLFTSVFSSHPMIIGSSQDHPAVLLAVAIAALVTQMGESASTAPTIFALILVTTLLAGMFVTLLGMFKLGKLVRYLPYPVLGGFIGGAGWLLAQGSIGAMADYPLALANLPDLLRPDQVIRWFPGVIFALVLFFGLRLIKHTLVLPGLLIGGLAVFFAALSLTGTSIEDAAARGLLLGTSGQQALWQPVLLYDLPDADWGAVFGQIAAIGAICVVTTISILLNISGLELVLHRDIDLNRELGTAGIGNLLSGLAGGTIGYPALSLTALSQRMGSGNRWTGIIAGGSCLLALVGSASVLAYVPRFLLGGLLLFLGLDFLNEWIVQSFRKLGRLDYLVVLTIVAVVASAGFLVGVGLGIVLMVILFVIQSSQVNIFRSALHGDEIVSHVLRNTSERRALAVGKRSIYFLELQGFVFFGTATGILERVRQRIASGDHPRLGHLILDFRNVIGLDSSAAYSLRKLLDVASAHEFDLIFTHLNDAGQYILTRSGVAQGGRLHLFEDAHHALEWCETQLLKVAQGEQPSAPPSLAQQLVEGGLKEDEAARLSGYLDFLELAEGDTLIRAGESATDVYFIESGQLSAYVQLNDGRRMRVQTLRPGAIVGELGFFLEMPRTASVIADSVTAVCRLSRRELETMSARDPQLAIAVNQLIGKLLAERLAAANRERAALMR